MLNGATIHFYCLFDESHFSNIFTLEYVIIECIELNWLCKHIKQRSSHYCTELSKTQFFSVSIVNKPVHLEKSIKTSRPPGDLSGIHSKTIFKKRKKAGEYQWEKEQKTETKTKTQVLLNLCHSNSFILWISLLLVSVLPI